MVDSACGSYKGRKVRMLYFVMGHVANSWLHHQCAGLSKAEFAPLPGVDIGFCTLIVAYLKKLI